MTSLSSLVYSSAAYRPLLFNSSLIVRVFSEKSLVLVGKNVEKRKFLQILSCFVF